MDVANLDVMRQADLNVMGLSATRQQALWGQADYLGLLVGLPDGPRPLADPLIQTTEDSYAKLFMCRNMAANPDTPTADREAACYAWHIWRERVDVWEVNPMIWTGGGRYDPKWRNKMWTEGAGFVLYDTFVSAFELERYFINPWIRAVPWLKQQANPMWLGEFKYRGEKGSKAVVKYAAEPLRWWQNRKPRYNGMIGPVEQLVWPSVGFVPVLQYPRINDITGTGWRNADPAFIERGTPDVLIHDLAVKAFSWEEFLWRQDEIDQLIICANTMLSFGSGGPGRLWSMEKKLLNTIVRSANNFNVNFLENIRPYVMKQVRFA